MAFPICPYNGHGTSFHPWSICRDPCLHLPCPQDPTTDLPVSMGPLACPWDVYAAPKCPKVDQSTPAQPSQHPRLYSLLSPVLLRALPTPQRTAAR